MQFCFWYNVIIFLYEYMEAMRTTTANEIIVPASPEKGDDLERSHQVVAMTIFITDVAVAFPVQGGVAVQTNTTSVVKDKEVGTFGDVVKALSVKHVFWMAVKKILRIPNTYASILGLIWSLIAFKYVPISFILLHTNMDCIS
jgi:auxin efflux carrier family